MVADHPALRTVTERMLADEVIRLRALIDQALYVMPWGDSEVHKAWKALREARDG